MKLASIGLLALISAPLSAQISDTRPPIRPTITVSARGETRVTPDRAIVRVGVQTRAATAAAAGRENARLAQRVIAAIKALGIGAEQISTVNYSVYPEHRQSPNREAEIVGYNVSNTVVVDVRQIDQVGPVVDAALANGANMITGLNFYASNTDEARRTALASAVSRAKAEAEVIARAAGGTLGGLAEASVGSYMIPRQYEVTALRVAGAPPPTPMEPGTETLAVDVSTRWYFNP